MLKEALVSFRVFSRNLPVGKFTKVFSLSAGRDLSPTPSEEKRGMQPTRSRRFVNHMVVLHLGEASL
jgi:hypothetical protein